MSKDKQEAFETFEFDLPPIRGFPELRWAGKRPFRSTQFFPAQKKEVYGDPTDGWWNKIFWGDNLQVMSHLLREFRGKVDLIYIDPPFDSKADYKKRVKVRGRAAESDQASFEEKQYSDIWNNDDYLQFLYERMTLIRELLSPSGSVYFHCDVNRGHYIKCLLDEIFGSSNFRNEIVWKRTSARADSKTYNHIHDTIFFYTKADEFVWNRQYTEHSGSYLKSKYQRVDENGRKRRLRLIDFASVRSLTWLRERFLQQTEGWHGEWCRRICPSA